MADFDQLTWQERCAEVMRRCWTPSTYMTTSTHQKGAPTSTSRSTYDGQRSKPPTLKSGLPWPVSLATRATAMATQAPEAAVSGWQRVQADSQEIIAGRGGAELSVQDAQEPARLSARAGF